MNDLLEKGKMSILDNFTFILEWWLFLFLIILLPLDMLFRAASLLQTFTIWRMWVNCASLIAFFVILALIIALFSVIFSFLASFLSQSRSEFVKKINVAFGFYFLIFTVSKLAADWFSMLIDLNSYIYVIGFIIIANISTYFLLLKRNLLINKAIQIISSFRKASYIIIFIGFITILINIFSLHLINGSQKTTIQSHSKSTYPNIILITFDALCAKRTSLHGYSRKTTPNLDELKKESYFFKNMYASSNWTVPSIVSLLTGKYPFNHNLNSLFYANFASKARNENLPFILSKLGYETVAVVANPVVIPWRLNLEGFDTTHAYFRTDNPYLNAVKMNSPFDIFPHPNYITSYMKALYESGFQSGVWLLKIFNENICFKIFNVGVKVCKKGLGWSDESNTQWENLKVFSPAYTLAQAKECLSQSKGPFFLWVHLWPPHSPYILQNIEENASAKKKFFDDVRDFIIKNSSNFYDPQDQKKIDQLSVLYENYIKYLDHEFGKFFLDLKQKGVHNNSIIIITSDHGESFERGFWGHASPFLYQSLIHIPLLIRLPGQTKGKEVNVNINHVDIAPTLLDLIHAEVPNWMDGKAFTHVFNGNGQNNVGKVFSMNLSFQTAPNNFKTESIAIIKGNYKLIKYIQLNHFELYDLKTDAEEQRNLVDNRKKLFQSLRAELESELEKN